MLKIKGDKTAVSICPPNAKGVSEGISGYECRSFDFEFVKDCQGLSKMKSSPLRLGWRGKVENLKIRFGARLQAKRQLPKRRLGDR